MGAHTKCFDVNMFTYVHLFSQKSMISIASKPLLHGIPSSHYWNNGLVPNVTFLKCIYSKSSPRRHYLRFTSFIYIYIHISHFTFWNLHCICLAPLFIVVYYPLANVVCFTNDRKYILSYLILFYPYPLLLAWFNFPAWINNHIHYDVLDKWNELLVHAGIEVKPC